MAYEGRPLSGATVLEAAAFTRRWPHLDGIEQAVRLAAGSAGIVRGKLRVNVDPFLSRVVLAGQIAGFLARHPEARGG